MGHERVRKLITALIMAVVLFGLVSPVLGIDHPVEPFQKAKALALMEGKPVETKSGKQYVLVIGGWGAIIYIPVKEAIDLVKGTPSDHSSVTYHGGIAKYAVSRVAKGGKPEMTTVDWSVAMDIAYQYLREIEAVRESK